ncbi:MAG: hypothetical protein AB7H77_09955 [Bdellovibrionales bacterium]
MKPEGSHKASFDEWLLWSNVLIDRLTTCVGVYNNPPHEDIFISERHRQQRHGHIATILGRIQALIDETEMPTDSLAELDLHAERVVDGLAVLFRETLECLPEVSIDMQRLLKSPWHSRCSSRLAEELFRGGPLGNEQEGIGSGLAEHGRLPSILKLLIEKERSGETRLSRTDDINEIPQRHNMWSERARILNSAGGMD